MRLTSFLVFLQVIVACAYLPGVRFRPEADEQRVSLKVRLAQIAVVSGRLGEPVITDPLPPFPVREDSAKSGPSRHEGFAPATVLEAAVEGP